MANALTRTVEGGRDAFFENPESDRLLAMLMRMLSEHWALRERVMALETLLIEHGIVTADAIDGFVPSADADGEWDRQSYELIRAVIDAARNIEPQRRGE